MWKGTEGLGGLRTPDPKVTSVCAKHLSKCIPLEQVNKAHAQLEYCDSDTCRQQ